MRQRREGKREGDGQEERKMVTERRLEQKVFPFHIPLLITHQMSPTCIYVLKSFFENPVSTSLWASTMLQPL